MKDLRDGVTAESATIGLKSDGTQWQRLKNILADALELTSVQERAIFIQQSCDGDTGLLLEAERLLAHDTTALEEFAEFSATCLRKNEYDRIGGRIGAYSITKELGRGGMGAVYLAERADGQFEKRVAIKILKRGTDTDEVLRRFRVERQILANLEHPNITRLLDAGMTIDGLPYVVMEFVDGISITDFVRRENVDVIGRLKLFLKVCSAVDRAHQSKIIHRDIKPSNVLVTRDGEPKLLDFGIAKLLGADADDGDVTVAIERRLTPRYAAPEQSAGQPATVATDVYSLGALLCQILTNKPPDENAIYDQAKHLHRHLSQIIEQATRRDPQQRYPSVADLAGDIERHLDGNRPMPLRRSKYGRIPRIWFVAALIIIIVALSLLGPPVARWLQKNWVRTAALSPSNRTQSDVVHSIAVLPFEPLGQHVNDELLGLGMADAVIGKMSNLKQLVVLPTSAVSKYKGPANDPLAAGRALQVDAIMTGTVQRSGNQVRVTVQLVNVASGRTLWSRKFDEDFTDIFAIQDTISDDVARSLALNLSDPERQQLAKHYTTNNAAYESYLMGLYFWNQRSREGLDKAIDYLGRAVESDSNFALAYALMADCYYLQVYYGYDRSPDRIHKAQASVARALLLDNSIAEAHVASAMVQLYEKSDQSQRVRSSGCNGVVAARYRAKA